MINVPTLKWITNLEQGKRIVVMLSITICTETSAIIYLFKNLMDSEKEKKEMAIEFGKARLEYQEKTTRATQIFYQDFYKDRFKEMDKALKVNDSALQVMDNANEKYNKKINTINKLLTNEKN